MRARRYLELVGDARRKAATAKGTLRESYLAIAASWEHLAAEAEASASEPTREDALTQAIRHVKEGDVRVARQRARVEQRERCGHSELAEDARKVLTLLGDSLADARDRLRSELRAHGLVDVS